MRGGAKFLHHGIKRQQRYVAEAITEEWRMVPGPLEVAWFAEETAAVERAVDALTKRLEKLEAKWVIDTVIATLTLLVQLPWVQFLRSCYDPRLY